MTSIIIKHSFVAPNLNRCLKQLFLNKVLNIVYVIIMTIPREALNSVVNSSYKYKMYYFTILGLNLPGGVSQFLWVTR